MIEAARLAGFGVGFLVIFGALGSGPTFALARNLPARLILSPIVGFALAASVLSVAALIMPMKIAAWILLLPGTVASAVFAIRVGRRKPRHGLREAAAPVSLVIVGLVLALIPGILLGTVGPTSLAIADLWWYISIDTWLRDYTLSDALPAEAAQYDLILSFGYSQVSFDPRLGLSVVNSAVSVLFGATPDETHLAFLGTLYSLLPATIWFAARMLGVGRVPAAVGAFFGLSPAMLHMVGDSTLGNLGGLLLAPAVLILGTRSLLRGTVGEISLVAILGGGLIAVYPEYLAPLVLIGTFGTATLVLYRIVRHGLELPWLLALAKRMGLLAVGIALISFVALVRAANWVIMIASGDNSHIGWANLPDRFFTLESFGAWGFGLLHLYELSRFDLLSWPQTILAIGLPVLLTLLVLWGALREGAQGALFVLGPIGVSLALGLYSYTSYQDGHCSYCAWKSFTFMLPFLGLGIALALQRLAPGLLLRREGLVRAVAAVGAVFVVFLGVAGVVRADAKLAIAQYRSPATVPTELREIADEVDKLPKPATILLEGADASAASPLFTVTSAYYLMSGEDTKISLDVTSDSAAYVAGADYAPDYSYVVTNFPGLQSGRTLIAQRGPYAVFRRAPIDVAIVRTRWAWDPSEGDRAIPWVTNPFELLISSEQSGLAALSLDLVDPQRTPSFWLDEKRIAANQSADGSHLCVEVPLKEGWTRLGVRPKAGSEASSKALLREAWLVEGGPAPSPPKVLGLRSVEAKPGRCPIESD